MVVVAERCVVYLSLNNAVSFVSYVQYALVSILLHLPYCKSPPHVSATDPTSSE